MTSGKGGITAVMAKTVEGMNEDKNATGIMTEDLVEMTALHVQEGIDRLIGQSLIATDRGTGSALDHERIV